MRLLIFGLFIGISAMHHEAILERGEAMFSHGDSTEVVAAIELRCGTAQGTDRKLCETDLRDAFATGATDADTVVRLHCTHFENGWVEDRTPSPLCATAHES